MSAPATTTPFDPATASSRLEFLVMLLHGVKTVMDEAVDVIVNPDVASKFLMARETVKSMGRELDDMSRTMGNHGGTGLFDPDPADAG